MTYEDSNRCPRTLATAYEESASQSSPRRTSPVHCAHQRPTASGINAQWILNAPVMYEAFSDVNILASYYRLSYLIKPVISPNLRRKGHSTSICVRWFTYCSVHNMASNQHRTRAVALFLIFVYYSEALQVTLDPKWVPTARGFIYHLYGRVTETSNTSEDLSQDRTPSTRSGNCRHYPNESATENGWTDLATLTIYWFENLSYRECLTSSESLSYLAQSQCSERTPVIVIFIISTLLIAGACDHYLYPIRT